MSIIQESGLRKFGTVLKLDDFKRSRDRRKLESDAFAYCAIDVVKACTAFAHTEGIRDNVRYVFEKGDPEDHLTKWFRECGYNDPHFAWSRPHTDDKGVEPVLGLQAADWLAYEYYLDADRLLYHTSTDGWALKQFETVQGHIMLRYESVAPNLPDAKAIFESVMNATSRLSKIKEEAEEGESPTVEPTAEMLKTPGPEAKA